MQRQIIRFAHFKYRIKTLIFYTYYFLKNVELQKK